MVTTAIQSRARTPGTRKGAGAVVHDVGERRACSDAVKELSWDVS